MESRAWTAAGWTMLHFLWVGALLAATAAGGRWLLRYASPNARYLFALFSLMAMAITPCVIAAIVLRSEDVPRRRSLFQSDRDVTIDIAQSWPRGGAEGLDRQATPNPVVAGARRVPVAGSSRRASWDSIARYAPWLWLIGTPVVFVTVATGLSGAERLRRQSRAVDDGDLSELCQRLARGLKIARLVAVGICDRLASPVLVGIVRPMILLPPAALAGWTPQQLEMVLLHELAHVRRWDNLVNLIQRIIESLFFFQPAVWWVSRWVRLEREYCCDALVVARTNQPYAYAESLAALAMPGITTRNAVVAMSDAHLVLRIRRILDVEETSMKLPGKLVKVLAILLLLPGLMAGSVARVSAHPSMVTVAVSESSIVRPRNSDADRLVFLPLASMNAAGELEGRLAQSWEDSTDGHERKYHLRKDVRWHDGIAVTAHDVKFTLDLLSHADVREITVESVVVIDDFTVRVRARQHEYMTEAVVYPRHLLGHLPPKDFFDWGFWTHPIGNGPYRFVRYSPQTMMEFEANYDYYRGQPAIRRLVLKFVGGTALTELLDSFGDGVGIRQIVFSGGGGVPVVELLSGNVDALAHVDIADIPRLANDSRFQVYYTLSSRRAQILWNSRDPLFSSRAVRRALTLAVDRRELHRVLNLPHDLPVTDGVYTGRQLRQGGIHEALAHDPRAAEALFHDAGWQRGNGGLRERDGEPFRFRVMVPAEASGLLSAALVVQAQLHRVGVEMRIERLNDEQARQRLAAGDFQAAIHWAECGPRGAADFLGQESSTGYVNPKAIELLSRALVEVDVNELDRVCEQLSEVVRRDVPVTFLFPEVLVSAAHRRIRGLSSPSRADPLAHLEILWLEAKD